MNQTSAGIRNANENRISRGDPANRALARRVREPGDMTRADTARSLHARSQKRLVAAGTRIRGQWRYLVRTTSDPFAEMPSGAMRDAQPRQAASDSSTRR
jgi:hypothetical protein